MQPRSASEPATTVSEYVARSRADQGLPPKVEDAAVLARVASMVATVRTEERKTA